MIISGPILRRALPDQIVLWLVSQKPLAGEFLLYQQQTPIVRVDIGAVTQTVRIGRRAYVSLIDFKPEQPLTVNEWLSYDLRLQTEQGEKGLADLLPDLLYPGEQRPSFVIKTVLNQVLHGSCRKPHYDSGDALIRVDEVLQASMDNVEARPALLMMSGDQIYADDVAGPMLLAIHQVIERLGLPHEKIEEAEIKDSQALYASEFCYYQREQLLPQTVAGQALKDIFFSGVRKPIFTSDSAQNHLITLSEVLAMYLLVWSPQLWSQIPIFQTQTVPNTAELATAEPSIPESYRQSYQQEWVQIKAFAAGLDRVQRALAHIPVYMIFDDHDVTDDWNLTRGWEEAAYSHPFSRQILGNAILGYWLCQGWGNEPQRFSSDFVALLSQSIQSGLEGEEQSAAEKWTDQNIRQRSIDELLRFESWHFCLPTTPKMVVLDTRTRRWRSENSLGKPSGLMDWEALSELQQTLLNEKSVILISAAPVFGVKLIEAVQRIFTYFGHALTVDAENWMAHKGAANVILNIFLHMKTPQRFVILSGDVHYSFAYDINIRFRKNSPEIWQITCSGFKNEFPHGLLKGFDRFNRWLYDRRSPLNWLTKRRKMEIKPRKPGNHPIDSVLNRSAVGRLHLDKTGKPTQISVLPADGGEVFFN